MPTITTAYRGEMLFETRIGKHTVTTDVAYAMGGEDRAPTAPQLFVTSLGSCIAAFVAHYCELHDIDAAGLTVEMSYDKVENPTRLVNLCATVRLPNGDCGKRIEAIQRVAAHCPVHETIATMQGLQIQVLGEQDCVIQP